MAYLIYTFRGANGPSTLYSNELISSPALWAGGVGLHTSRSCAPVCIPLLALPFGQWGGTTYTLYLYTTLLKTLQSIVSIVILQMHVHLQIQSSQYFFIYYIWNLLCFIFLLQQHLNPIPRSAS